MKTWERVPLDDITVSDIITLEGDPVPMVLCPCGAKPLINDAGPGGCPGCGWGYRINREGFIERTGGRKRWSCRRHLKP